MFKFTQLNVGGMENFGKFKLKIKLKFINIFFLGLITYAEDGLLLNQNESNKLQIQKLIAHEL